MSVVQDSLKRSSIQRVCVCVLTMTTFLKAGIRPITGKQRGSEATQNPLSWLSMGFHCRANNSASSPLHCQKQCLCVVWRIPIPRRCLEWGALPELIKMLAFWQPRTQNFSLSLKTKAKKKIVLCREHFCSGSISQSVFCLICLYLCSLDSGGCMMQQMLCCERETKHCLGFRRNNQ